MFIDASSWKSNLAAYGMWICEIFVLFLHGRHSNEFFFRLLNLTVSLFVSLSVRAHFGFEMAQANLRNRSHQPTDVTNVHSESIRHLK